MTKSSGWKVLVRQWLRYTAAALVILALLKVFLVEAFTIPTSSMERTLLPGDFVLVNKLLYGAEIPGTSLRLPAIREPQRGEVVVFRPPHEPHAAYVKRVVGIPGDTLQMRRKVLWVNGSPSREPYVVHTDFREDPAHPSMRWQVNHLVDSAVRGTSKGSLRRYRPSRDNWGPLLVPPGKYFVLGDNRDVSEDSRYWGFVDREAIVGHPWVVYLSLSPEASHAPPWVERVRWDRTGERVR